jgi:SAM-dependent methyltransferase
MRLMSQRSRQPEIMDNPDLNPTLHVQALRGLSRINLWSRSAASLWPPLRDLARSAGSGPVRALDVATGGGDVPVRLWRQARKAGLALEVEGCDVSPVAIEHARNTAAKASAEVRFFVHDALNRPLPAEYDAVICSLFLHHLTEEEAIQFLRQLAGAARKMVLINDLARCWTGLFLAHLGTRLLTASPVVHFDGPRSVEGAFTPAEAAALAERAGLQGVRVARCWPCRYLLTWRRT